jgi:hypothetical protein
MAFNPFRAIGNAIRGVFGGRGGGEAAPPPAPSAPSVPAAGPGVVPGRRGGLAGLWDRFTGADRRRELEGRERQVAERERQVAERERDVQPPQVPEAPEVDGSVQPPQAPGPDRDLPKFVGGGGGDLDYWERDERAFGIDSDIERRLQEAVDDFISNRGGLDGLVVDAREWLMNPTVSEPFSDYWHSGGFTADQVLAGMQNISNIQIVEGDDGEIHIEFDYDSEVNGYPVSGHASA